MIHTYFLATEAFVIAGYLLGAAIFPKRYPLIFYKFLGITVFSLVLWYLALFTGKGWTSLIPYAGFFYMALVGIATYFGRARLRLPTRKELMVFVGIEILSYLIYLFLVYIRTFKPDILGTEKLMDVALINTIMKQNHIPIENPWLSGFYMNYYYFGHFILGLFQYILQIPTAVGYNLAISLFGVWILQAGYLIARSLRLSDMVSFLVSFVMTFGGNLYLLIQAAMHSQSTQWFASATRVIPYTINEFPGYSVILGDLHGHYLSYPFFLVGIFLLVDIFFGKQQSETKADSAEEWTLPKSIFLGILLGHLYLTNSWDVFALAAQGAIFAGAIVAYMRFYKRLEWKPIIEWIKKLFIFVGVPVAVTSIPQFLSSRSYYLPPVGGVGLNTSFSHPFDMFMLFGQFLLVVIASLIMITLLRKSVLKKQFETFVYSPAIMSQVLLLVVGVVLVFAVEFVYAKDVFTVLNPPYARTNTVFKIYFHAWVFLSLGAASLFLTTFKEAFEKLKKPFVLFPLYGLFFAIVAVMLSYPVIAVDQYIVPNFEKIAIKRVIDPRWSNGYAFMNSGHGEDYDLVSYLLTKPHATVLEIVTYDSYSYYARVSAYSGLSAVTGWPLHNVQWYNGYDGKGINTKTLELEPMGVAQRVTDVEKLYTSDNKEEVQSLLEKYDITYAVFGDQERVWAKEKSKTLNSDIYASICGVEWEKNGTILYNCTKK